MGTKNDFAAHLATAGGGSVAEVAVDGKGQRSDWGEMGAYTQPTLCATEILPLRDRMTILPIPETVQPNGLIGF
jgi:hypothetical protein